MCDKLQFDKLKILFYSDSKKINNEGDKKMQAKRIKAICAYRGMTVTALAEKIGKTQNNFVQILKRDNFRESELEQIATALDCTLKIEFIDNKTDKPFL